MNQATLQQHPTTGRYLWLVIGLALGLALGSQTAVAKECHRETPLPADVRLVAPGPEVPEAMARFAGAWIGVSEGPRRSDPLCHTLVVEEVFTNGYARVIYSYSSSVYWGIRLPSFLRATGRVIDGELRFQVPIRERPQIAYRVAGETLEGTFAGPQGAIRLLLSRVADLGQVGCGPQAGRLPPAPSTTGPRDRLTAAELLAAEAGTGPIHNAYFLPIGQVAPAVHAFKGTVMVQAATMLRGRHGCSGLAETLPGFSAAFFTHGEYLVPVVRDILNLPGTLILSPGRVWAEPGDRGMSRASFPFVVTNPYNNATHNGLATFLYDDTWVSALRFQVVQETAAWAKFDGWGQTHMTYAPGPIADEEAVRAQFVAELQQQTPIRPWSSLWVSSGAQWLEGFDGDTAPEDVSVSGLIVDGAIYLRGCETRAGPYPYCRHMRHGAFSVTKSLGAAVALLQLAQKYGNQVFALKIKDYVTVTAGHDGWERVTFGDALNMATGIGDNWPKRESNQPFADENNPKISEFLEARTAKQKLDIGFSYGKYLWGPGEVLRYNSTQTFILAAAMDSFLKRQEGPHAQLWDIVVANVFRPLGIFHAPMLHTQETEGGRGIPHLLHGLYPTIDDIAKLTTLLQHGGRHQGQQLLHAAKLAEALDTTEARGLPSRQENRFGEGRYHLSFWSVPYRTAIGCVFQIPYMSGFGGNAVVLLPNGISAFRFADGHHYDVDTMVLAAEAVRPFPCPAGSAETPPLARPPLTASDLRTEVPGNTFYQDPVTSFPVVFGGRLSMFVSADGTLYGTFTRRPDGGTEHDVGRWHITPEGQFCRTWHVWDHRHERCYTLHLSLPVMYRGGESFEFAVTDRWETELYRRVPGNAEGY
jgi:Beta-lactamase